MRDYIRWIRERVGHEPIILNFAVACIFDAEGRILLQRRGDRDDADAWGFPGGAIELGESAEEAMLREVREETGLAVTVESLLGVYTNYFDEYPNGDQAQTIAIFFVCSAHGGLARVDGRETLELRFFAPSDAPPLFTQQHRDALADLIARRRGVFR